MAEGKVIVAHRSERVRSAVVDRLSARGIVCAVARQAAEVLLVQAATRSDAVLMDMDWVRGNVLAALQRDVVHPYVLVCSRAENSRTMCRMGASDVVCEKETGRICDMIDRNLCHRVQMEEDGNSAFSAALSRLFSDCGLPCHLRGYRYLMFAVQMLASGEGSVDCLGSVYRRASERYGCSASAIERGMNQAVQLVNRRCADQEMESVQGFLSRILDETGRTVGYPAVRPRVAVFSEGVRGFF